MAQPQGALTPQQHSQKRRAQIIRVALGVMVVAIIAAAAIVVVAGSNSGPVTTADAIHNLVAKINSGPTWKTAKISNGVAGYLKGRSTDKGKDGSVSCKSLLARGPNVGCGQCVYVNGRNPNAGFACFLQASPSHGYAVSYFSENASGDDIRPISISQYGKLLGPSPKESE